MTCRDLIEFLTDYLSESLTVEERGIFDDHLAVCPACVTYIRTYRETVRLGKAALAGQDHGDEIPKEVPPELLQAILASRPRDDNGNPRTS